LRPADASAAADATPERSVRWPSIVRLHRTCRDVDVRRPSITRCSGTS